MAQNDDQRTAGGQHGNGAFDLICGKLWGVVDGREGGGV